MLKKLMYYDSKNLAKTISIGYLVLLLFSLVTRALFFLNQKYPIFSLAYGVMTILFWIVFFLLPFLTLFVAIRRFYRHIYSDEGYLTNTLPVSKREIFVSKLVVGILFFVLTCVVMMVSLGITYGGRYEFSTFWEVPLGLREAYGITSMPLLLFLVSLFCLVVYIGGYLSITMGIVIGQARDKNKVGHTVLTVLISYVIYEIVNILFLFGYSYLRPSLMDDLTLPYPPKAVLVVILLGILIIELLYSAVCYVLTERQCKIKFDVE